MDATANHSNYARFSSLIEFGVSYLFIYFQEFSH
jgi:hypothetical protein